MCGRVRFALGQKTTPKTTPIATPITTKDKLTQWVLAYPSITREEIAKELRVSINTVKEYILKLKKDGFLQRVGDNRNGYWEISTGEET